MWELHIVVTLSCELGSSYQLYYIFKSHVYLDFFDSMIKHPGILVYVFY